MTELLCKWFVESKKHDSHTARRRRYGSMVSVVGILVNVLLFAGKLSAGLLSGSVSIVGDAVNNLSDAGSSVISLITFKIAEKPADREHPFGHARMEYVASMIVSFLILLIGFELFSESLDKALHPAPPLFGWLPVIILAVSIGAKLWLFFFNRKVAAKIDSAVMRATAADSLSDACATGAVLLSLIVYRLTDLNLDAYMGMAVSVFIFVAGIRILNETKNSILGEAPDPQIVEDIHRIVSKYPEALDIHDLSVHSYGPGRTVASLHVEVDGAKDIFYSHDMIDLIEREIADTLGIRCTIHMDPIVTDDEQVDRHRAMTLSAVKRIDERIRVHDFRFVMGVTHKNLIFDVAVPFELEMENRQLCQRIEEEIQKEDPMCLTVITVDRE